MKATGAERRRAQARVILAGPLVLLASFASLAGVFVFTPPGVAGVNHLVMPMLLQPIIWAALFFYASLDERLGRAYLVVLGIIGLSLAAAAAYR